MILTSNIGSSHIQDILIDREKRPVAYWGKTNEEELRESVMADLKAFFKPEFLNRVDEIVIFNPLSRALLKQIVQIQVDRMKKYLKEKGVDIVLTEAAKERLGDIGYDPVYGARPLKRAIQREVLNPLAVKLLDRTFAEGDVVEVDCEADRFTFRKRVGAEVAV